MVTISTAHNQWARRPADERFASIDEFVADARLDRAAGGEVEIAAGEFDVEPVVGGGLALAGHGTLTNWSAGQLATRAGAPHGYLSSLPPSLAADCLNYGLDHRRGELRDGVILEAEGRVRSLNSPRYGRVWDADVAEWIVENLDLGKGGWRNPPAYQIEQPANGPAAWPELGEGMAPSGLYRGDRDSFIFFINDSVKVDAGDGRSLSRGFFIWNSEVGAKSFGIQRFLYDFVCGNHYVWGAELLDTAKVRHVGEAWERVQAELKLRLKSWTDEGVAKQEEVFKKARTTVIDESDAVTIGRVSGWTGMSVKKVSEAHDLGSTFVEVDGPTNTIWGMTSSLTRYAQLSKWTEERVAIDRAAAKLMVRLAA